MIVPSTLIAIISGLIHVLLTAGVYWIGPIVGIKIYLVAIIFLEFLIGLVLGFVSGNSEERIILMAAGIGGFIGFLPPILVTYGFALVASPVFLIYLAVLYFGLRISRYTKT